MILASFLTSTTIASLILETVIKVAGENLQTFLEKEGKKALEEIKDLSINKQGEERVEIIKIDSDNTDKDEEDTIKQIKNIASYATPVESYTRKDKNNLEEIELIRRIPKDRSFSVSKISDGEKIKLITLLESKDVFESPKYKECIKSITKLGIEPPVAHVVGRAQIQLPNNRGSNMPDFIMSHRPGRAVANQEGRCGTLGAYVISRDNNENDIYGFVSASHVLYWNNNTTTSTGILSPGPPPNRYRKAKYIYGRFMDGTILVPYNDRLIEEVEVNATDIAWARMSDDSNFPGKNLVPKPNNPDDVAQLQGVLSQEEIFSRIIRDGYIEVYKIGQASGFSRGRFSTGFATPIAITHGRKNFLYDQVGYIEPSETISKFSIQGDSGAIVYTEDLYVLGFIVAGTETHTVIHPADLCLRNLGVELC